MNFCINYNHPTVEEMAKESGLDKRIIAAKIGTWMSKNNTTEWPNLSDLDLTLMNTTPLVTEGVVSLNNNLYNIQSNTSSQDYKELENLTTQFRMNERGYMANVPEADFRELVKRVSKLFNGEIKVRKVKSNTSTVIMFKGNKMITPSEITSRQLYNINNKSQDDIKADNKYIETLNDKLIEILRKAGIGVSRVTGLDKLIDAYGEYSPDSLKKTVDGLKELIRISNDIEGIKSLPEEFAHFIIDSLSDTPLVRRLLTVIDNDATIKEILGDSYNEYKRKYNGDRSKLIYEAAGKVLAKHLLKQQQISQDKPYRNILQRTIDFIKSIFRKIDENTLNIVVSETDALYSQFAKDILDEKINKLQSERLSTNRLFNVVKETLSRNKKVIDDLIKRQLQIRDIRNKLENAVPNSSKELSDVSSPIARNSEKATSLLNHLNLLLLKNKNNELPESLFLEAMNEIVTFMTSSLEEAKIETETNIADINGNFIATSIETAKKLREVYYFINFISESQKDLQSLLSSIRTESDYDSKSDEIKKAYFDLSTSLSNTIKIYSDISSENNNQSIKLFSGFLKPFYGKKVTIPFGKDKGKEISFEDILKKADQDISWTKLMLDSMANSSDDISRIIDNIVKEKVGSARQRTIKMTKRLQELKLLAEQEGILNFEYMFEKDKEGYYTGFFINDPKHLSDRQKYYYVQIRDIKKELDLMLPPSKANFMAVPRVRKDFVERLKGAKSFSDIGAITKRGIGDMFVQREDDADFGEFAETLEEETFKNKMFDPDGRNVNTLPVLYTSPLKDKNDLSTDIISSLMLYSNMAYKYNELYEVVDILEVGRTLLSNRDIERTEDGSKIKQILEFNGKTRNATKVIKQKESNIGERLDIYYTMQLYGNLVADEGDIKLFNKNISIAKVADTANLFTSLMGLAVNVLAATSNIIVGNVNITVESIAGQHFTLKDAMFANKILVNPSMVFPYLGELGNRVKHSKLSLFNELFDIDKEHKSRLRNANMDRKWWSSQFFELKSLFFLTTLGETQMRFKTAIAIANKYKLIDTKNENKEISLWDALEVKTVEKDGVKIKSELVIKEGITKEDGSLFSEIDITKLSNKISGINNELQGIYNDEDKSAAQRVALGRLAFMFRKYLKPALNRRFNRNPRLNYDTNEWTEGYYITGYNFIRNVITDLKKAEGIGIMGSIKSNWNELSKNEYHNMIRSITEIAIFASLLIAQAIVFKDWDDDDDDLWIKNYLKYTLLRVTTEIGSLTPTPMLPDSFQLMFRSPVASIRLFESTGELLKFWSYGDIIEKGRYEGKPQIYKSLMEIIPMNKTLYRVFNPEESIKYFQ